MILDFVSCLAQTTVRVLDVHGGLLHVSADSHLHISVSWLSGIVAKQHGNVPKCVCLFILNESSTELEEAHCPNNVMNIETYEVKQTSKFMYFLLVSDLGREQKMKCEDCVFSLASIGLEQYSSGELVVKLLTPISFLIFTLIQSELFPRGPNGADVEMGAGHLSACLVEDEQRHEKHPETQEHHCLQVPSSRPCRQKTPLSNGNRSILYFHPVY